METVYLNGRFMPLEEAHVPVMDRGFLFGDGVYEVMPVFNNRIFRLAERLRRMEASLQGLNIPNPMLPHQWEGLLNDLVAKNGGGWLYLYLHISRGVARRDHNAPRNLTPTVFAMTNVFKPVKDAWITEGISAITHSDLRWARCNIKSTNLLPNVMLRQQAVDEGAMEAIFLRDGLLTEAAASNVFVARGGELFTPPLNHMILPGVTRDLVLELGRKAGMPIGEKEVDEEHLREADEIFTASSVRELVPVVQLDGRPVGEGKPGPLYKQMLALYNGYKREICGAERPPA